MALSKGWLLNIWIDFETCHVTLSVCLSVCHVVCLCLPICPPLCSVFVFLSVCVHLAVRVCLSTCLSVTACLSHCCLSVRLCVGLSPSNLLIPRVPENEGGISTCKPACTLSIVYSLGYLTSFPFKILKVDSCGQIIFNRKVE